MHVASTVNKDHSKFLYFHRACTLHTQQCTSETAVGKNTVFLHTATYCKFNYNHFLYLHIFHSEALEKYNILQGAISPVNNCNFTQKKVYSIRIITRPKDTCAEIFRNWPQLTLGHRDIKM